MADVLSTSVSGLLAFQNALSVTSNNVANAATPGYSVETPNFAAQPGVSTSAGTFGNGVQIASVTRSYSELLAGQMRSSQSSYSSFNAYSTTAATVDNMLSDTTTGLTAHAAELQQFAADPGQCPHPDRQRPGGIEFGPVAGPDQYKDTPASCRRPTRTSKARSATASQKSIRWQPASPTSTFRSPRNRAPGSRPTPCSTSATSCSISSASTSR